MPCYATKAGASREEIAEAPGAAVVFNAGAALVFSARVMDAYSSKVSFGLPIKQIGQLSP